MARPQQSWFRVYERMIDSPQILELSDAEFRLIVSLWCLASGNRPRGVVPLSPAALRRRCMAEQSPAAVEAMLEHLSALDLVSRNGVGYVVNRWADHQYDSPADRPERRQNRPDSGETVGHTWGDCGETVGHPPGGSGGDGGGDSGARASEQTCRHADMQSMLLAAACRLCPPAGPLPPWFVELLKDFAFEQILLAHIIVRDIRQTSVTRKVGYYRQVLAGIVSGEVDAEEIRQARARLHSLKLEAGLVDGQGEGAKGDN